MYTEGTSTFTTYYYAGGSYEMQSDGTTETARQYYSIAGMTVAMKVGAYGDTPAEWVFFLTDHLGSVVGVTDASGMLVSETRYLPFGEVRVDIGSITRTDFGYTSGAKYPGSKASMGTFQRNLPEMGLMDYKARFYNSALGRFVQPDTIIPGAGNPQAYNRFSYVLNMPIMAIDPSGHKCKSEADECEKEEVFTTTEKLEKKYSIDIKGSWSSRELDLLRDTLIKYASYVGGTNEFNELLNATASNIGFSRIGFERIPGEGSVGSTPGNNGQHSAAWCSDFNSSKCSGSTGNIVLSDNVFSNEYQIKRVPFRRTFGLNANEGAQVTMAHELTHVFIEAMPQMAQQYNSQYPNFPITTKNGTGDENLSIATAFYVITGGFNLNGTNLSSFLVNNASLWEVGP